MPVYPSSHWSVHNAPVGTLVHEPINAPGIWFKFGGSQIDAYIQFCIYWILLLLKFNNMYSESQKINFFVLSEKKKRLISVSKVFSDDRN